MAPSPALKAAASLDLPAARSTRTGSTAPAFGDWDALADPGPSAYEVAGFEQTAPAM